MREIGNPLNLDQSGSPWISIISLFLLVLGGTILFGFLLAMMFLLPMGFDSVEGIFQNISKDISPEVKVALMIFQGSASVGGFILGPLVFLHFVAKIKPITFFSIGRLDFKGVILTFLMVILFMVVDAPIIEWNQSLKFPDFLAEYEQMALAKEVELAEITEILTTFDSIGQFLLGVLVIAAIPAIGEEFLFRGIIQNYILKMGKNYHLAIWIAALIFGAFHLQFYGLVPRILLGALFGYLYVWSGSLWVAILAHFINNGFTLLMSYMHQKGGVEYNIQSATLPPVYMILLALVFFIGLVYIFRKQYFVKT